MAKRNHHETVEWFVEWGDVPDKPASEQEARLKDKVTQETHNVTEAETLSGKVEADVPSTATQLYSEQEPAVFAKLTPSEEGVSTTQGAVSFQRQAVSLTKEPEVIVRKEAHGQNRAAAKTQLPSQKLRPPPLPTIARAAESSDATMVEIGQPPPLLEATKVSQASDHLPGTPGSTGKVPPAVKTVRRPPSSISSIFKREEPSDSPESSSVEGSKAVPEAPVVPRSSGARAPDHAKLGPAFQISPQGEDKSV